jgi:N-acetylglutamate synthase-like GNAT family acetyltransferase
MLEQKASVTIQEANTADAEALAALIRDAFADVARRFGITAKNTPRHPSNCTGQWVTEAMGKGVCYYKMAMEGFLCGCVALEQAGEGAFYLERLAVRPDCRRHGLGRALVEHACSEAFNHGAGRMAIGIIDAQAELKDWYVRLGFEETRTANFDHLPFTVCFMKKDYHDNTK